MTKTKVPEPSFSKDIDIVTGHQGKAHVTSAQEARCTAGIIGKGQWILDIGEKFAITVDSATQVTIGTGDAIIMGRHVTIEAPIKVPLKPGKQGVKRGAIVCLRVEPAGKDKVDKAKIVVLDGEETTGDIDYPYAHIKTSTMKYSIADMSLWLIPIDGITVGKPKPARDYHVLTSVSEIRNEIKSTIHDEITDMKTKMDKVLKVFSIYESKGAVIESQRTPFQIDRDITFDDEKIGTFTLDFERYHIIRKKNVGTSYEDSMIENFFNMNFRVESNYTSSQLDRWRKLYPFCEGECSKKEIDPIEFSLFLSHNLSHNQYAVKGDWGYISGIVDISRMSEERRGLLLIRDTIYGKDHITITKREKQIVSFRIDSAYINALIQRKVSAVWNGGSYTPTIFKIVGT